MKVDDIKLDSKFAKRLPEAKPSEQAALVEDIRQRGLIVPLVVTKKGLLLDGHRRLAAAKEIGLRDVPTRAVDIDGDHSWGSAFAIAMNLRRRHLNEAQRADLGSSLLRIERVKAKARHAEAVKRGGRGKKKLLGNSAPGVLIGSRAQHAIVSVVTEGNAKRTRIEYDRATQRVAAAVGVSRKTIERVEAVKKKDPETAKRMLEGGISVAGAAKKLKAKEIQERAKVETPEKPGVLKNLEDGVGRFRTVYADPPWKYGDEGAPGGGLGEQYSTMSVEQLEALNVGTLGHPEGSHLWMWTTWPMVRERVPHRVLEAWGYRWVGEILWVKPGLGVGRWLRPASEVLILGVKGTPSLPLLRDDQKGLLEAPRGRHSAKPEEAYEIIERLSPGPYIELFARRERAQWLRWGNEA